MQAQPRLRDTPGNNHLENRVYPWAMAPRAWLFAGSELAGQRAAIAHYKGRPEHAALKNATLQTPDWWQPQGLWGRGIKALKRSGILPADAFKAPAKR